MKKKNVMTPSRATRSITLDDVAKVAGVSPITVSRVLNYPDKVAEKTREKVQLAIDKTGYVPNLLAGGLASKKSRLIAAIIPAMANSVYAETIRAFSETMRQAGYQVLLGESNFGQESEELLLSAVLSRRPDGIYLTGVDHSSGCKRLLLSADIPLVETWDLTTTPLDTVVGFSHRKIGEAVATYFWNKGYRNIGMVSANDYRATVRKKGFIETLQSYGIRDVAVSTIIPPSTFKAGREGLAELLDNGFGEGAIFFSSDTLAQGGLAEAQSRGIRIPEQLAMIGLGDQPYAAYTYPALSTVRFDLVKIGQRAAEMLLDRIDEKEMEEKVIDVGFEIVERETT